MVRVEFLFHVIALKTEHVLLILKMRLVNLVLLQYVMPKRQLLMLKEMIGSLELPIIVNSKK